MATAVPRASPLISRAPASALRVARVGDPPRRRLSRHDHAKYPGVEQAQTSVRYSRLLDASLLFPTQGGGPRPQVPAPGMQVEVTPVEASRSRRASRAARTRSSDQLRPAASSRVESPLSTMASAASTRTSSAPGHEAHGPRRGRSAARRAPRRARQRAPRSASRGSRLARAGRLPGGSSRCAVRASDERARVQAAVRQREERQAARAT